MEAQNHTTVKEFILLGLTENSTLRVILFMIFLGIYTVTLVGNFSIISLIRSCPQLHTPMYLFLSHLALVDIGFSTSITPTMFKGFLGNRLVLSVAACIAQFCITVTFGTVECFLLAVMAYDRYVAICSPLLYSTHMSPRICFLLVGASYVGGCVNSGTFTSCLLILHGLSRVLSFGLQLKALSNSSVTFTLSPGVFPELPTLMFTESLHLSHFIHSRAH